MKERNRSGQFILFLALLTAPNIVSSQEFINTRKITLTRGDTTIVAGILADLKLESIDPDAVYFWYANSGIYCNQGGFSGNLLHGDYLEYDSKGNLLLKGKYERGLKSGDWICWYPNGTKKSSTSYKNGKRHGSSSLYSSAGETVNLWNYRKDHLHGYSTVALNDTIYRITYFRGIEKSRKILDVHTDLP